MHQSAKEGACGQYNALSVILDLEVGFDTYDLTILAKDFGNLSLFTIEIALSFADPFKTELIGLFIALCSWSPNCRSFLLV